MPFSLVWAVVHTGLLYAHKLDTFCILLSAYLHTTALAQTNAHRGSYAHAHVNAPTTQHSSATHLCAGVSIPVVHQVESGQVKQLGKGHDQGLVHTNEGEKVRKELSMQQAVGQ
jgi:hypothetical protein